MSKYISPEQRKTIVNVYLSGKTTKQTAKETGFCQSFVCKVLKENNIKTRKAYDYEHNYYKNKNINYEALKSIDTEEKAYFLGFMYADGNNYVELESSHRTISINLQEEDKYIIEKFRDLIAPGYNLSFINKKKYNENHKNQYRLSICNKPISDRMLELGCFERKSLKLKWPEWLVDPELQRHFIRGYFDGDGCISFSKRKDRNNAITYSCTITSTLQFLEEVKKILIKNNIRCSIQPMIPDNGITHILNCGGSTQSYNISKWMYNNSSIFLKRKYIKYKELENLINNRDLALLKDLENKKEVIRLYLEGEKSNKITEKTGYGKTNIRRILKENNIPLLDRANKERNDQIIKIYLSGKSLSETGKQFGLQASSVNEILIKNKIQRRPAKPYKK